MDPAKLNLTFQEIKDYNIFLVNDLFKRITEDGITYLGNLFDISRDLQAKITQIAKFAAICLSGNGTWPLGFTWEAVNGTNVTMTEKQFVDFNLAIGTFIGDATTTSINHIVAIDAITDIPTLLVYNTTTGWPSKFTDYTFVSSIRHTRIFSGNFAQQSGTPTIPHDNTTPLSTEGVEVMSQTVTPATANSKFIIQACLPVDANTNGAHLTAAIFRGTTCIGVSSLEAASKGLIGLSNSQGTSLNVLTTDSPATILPITYSIRFGSSAGTWFLNRTSAASFGDVGNKGWMIMEII